MGSSFHYKFKFLARVFRNTIQNSELTKTQLSHGIPLQIRFKHWWQWPVSHLDCPYSVNIKGSSTITAVPEHKQHRKVAITTFKLNTLMEISNFKFCTWSNVLVHNQVPSLSLVKLYLHELCSGWNEWIWLFHSQHFVPYVFHFLYL